MNDPFLNAWDKPCEHCAGRGYNRIMEQLPPPELIVCSCCHGKGLFYHHQEGKSYEILCKQCDGLRYQKNEILQYWLDLKNRLIKDGEPYLYLDLEKLRGVKLTSKEAEHFGLTPLQIIN
jgi:hypothetical protein